MSECASQLPETKRRKTDPDMTDADWNDADAMDMDGWNEDDSGWGDMGADDGAAWDDNAEWTEQADDMKDQPALVRQKSYAVLSSSALQEHLDGLVKSTADLLFVTSEEASCLLRHYQWKNTDLQREWFSDQNKVRQKVGLTRPSDSMDTPKRVQCSSAFCDEVPFEDAFALNCGHYFCQSCWTGYLTSEINKGRTCVFTTCMGMACTLNHNHKFGCACHEMVPSSVFARFVLDKDLMDKYKRWVLDSYVEGQNNIKWCANPKCDLAVEYKSGGVKAVACDCHYKFCFSCSQDAHVPAPCDVIKRWREKEKSDDATEIWLAARTKKCPGCNIRIEKNRACNHMKCAKCGHDFCWLCKGPWGSHGSATGGYYVCKKYTEASEKGNLSTEEKSIRENTQLLQKYTYYYKRYKDSEKGIQLTEKRWKTLEAGLKNKEFTQYAFLQDAVQRLIEARSVLMFTYAMAYYLAAGKEKRLFEYQQDLLVSNLEKLQEMMDSKNENELVTARKDILNLISAIDKFKREMILHVDQGDFEALLLSHPDISAASNKWACSFCQAENKMDAKLCVKCQACKLHGEPDCRGCTKTKF